MGPCELQIREQRGDDFGCHGRATVRGHDRGMPWVSKIPFIISTANASDSAVCTCAPPMNLDWILTIMYQSKYFPLTGPASLVMFQV